MTDMTAFGPLTLIDRPRLAGLLDASASRRLTTVIGGAGFGKTTLLRQWGGNRTAWLAITPDGTRPNVIAGAIIDAFAAVGIDLRGASSADLGAAVETEAPTLDAASAARRGEAIAGTLADALEETLNGRLTLVIDDLHEVASEGGSAALIGGLIRQAPSDLRFVIAARSALPFPIERMRARGELAEIAPAELAFDAVEVGRLVDVRIGEDGGRLGAAVFDATRGWPAAVRLAIEWLASLPVDARLGAVGHLGTARGPIFGFVAEEVVAGLSAAAREVITTLARVDEFDADLCGRLGLPDAEATLVRLQLNGLVAATPASRLAMHALLRDFARERLPPPSIGEHAVFAVAADWHASQGRPEDGLAMAAASASPKVLIERLRRDGPGLILQGRTDAIIAASSALGSTELPADVEQILGDAHAHRAEWADAVARYAAAERQRGGRDAALAWRMARVAWDQGVRGALLESLPETGLEEASPRDAAMLLAWRAIGAWRMDHPDATAMADRAVDAARRAADDSAIALAEMVAGYVRFAPDWPAAREHMQAAVRAAEAAGDVVQLIRLRAAGQGDLDPDAYLADAVGCLALADAAGSPISIFRSALTCTKLAIWLGRYDEAGQHVDRVREAGLRLGADVVETLLAPAELALARGDTAQADAGFAAALEVARRTDDPNTIAQAAIGLARVRAKVDPDGSRALVREARDRVLPIDQAEIDVDAGWVALLQGDMATPHAAAERAIAELTGVPEVLPLLAHSLELAAMSASRPETRRARLEEALGIWRRVGNAPAEARASLGLAMASDGPAARVAAAQARERLQALGVHAGAWEMAGLLGALPAPHAPPLVIRALGGFSVLRDGQPVAIAEWQGRKARDLLRILIARGGPMPRDELSEMLWPDEAPDAVSNRLSVALSIVRAVLDPTHAHPADHFLLADPDAVRVQRTNLVIDVDEFTANAAAGFDAWRRGDREAGRRLLIEAESGYGGDLFDEDPYSEWAILPREEARATYVRVARTLADGAAAEHEHDAAASYLRRIIGRDPYDEASHLALVGVLREAHQHGEARRAYQAYVGRMSEIEIEPAPYPSSVAPARSGPDS